MFRPFGNLVRLPDGRTLQKQANGVWIDVNSGVKMNDTMVGNLMYSSVFYGVPDGGVGKDTPRFVVGVAGSFTITNWLNDAKNGTDSVDFGWISDSNTARCNLPSCLIGNPRGMVDHWITAGISAGIKVYGTPIYFANKGAPAGYKSYGYQTNPASNKGWTSGFTYGPPHLTNQYSSGGGAFSPNFDDTVNGGAAANLFARDGYAWLPAGVTGFASDGASQHAIGFTGPFRDYGYTPPLTLRFLAGTTGNTGGLLPLYYYDETGARWDMQKIPVTFTGGFTGHNIGLTGSFSTNIGITNGIFISFLGQNAAGFWATGPVAVAMHSVFSKNVKGIASSIFFGISGITLGGLHANLTLAGTSGGNRTIINMLTEYHTRQKVAGGSGRVCINILGGVNLDNGATNAEKIQNSETNTRNIIDYVTQEWNNAGLPSDKLTFLVMNTWTTEVGSQWSTMLPTLVSNQKTYFNDRSRNVTYVDMLTFAGTYAGLTAGDYYDKTSPNPGTAHLSNGLTGGYHYISYNIMSALLKQRNTNK
jgi:hypothetical protein